MSEARGSELSWLIILRFKNKRKHERNEFKVYDEKSFCAKKQKNRRARKPKVRKSRLTCSNAASAKIKLPGCGILFSLKLFSYF